MHKDAIQEISNLSAANKLQFDGRDYTDKEVYPIDDPTPLALKLNSLTGLVDYLKTNVDAFDMKELIIQVESYDRVDLYSKISTKWQQRKHLLCITREKHGEGFPFERELDGEKFVIALQANFVKTDNLAKVLKVAGNMRAEQSIGSKDDGVSQNVELKTGVVLASRADVPNPVTLQPFRTFPEVTQPESEFVFRVHQRGNEAPKCSLTAADGGRWKIQAIHNIRDFLKTHIESVAILA
jgi:hypothetical protein